MSFDYEIVRLIVDSLDDVAALENLRLADLGPLWNRSAAKRQCQLSQKVLLVAVADSGEISTTAYLRSSGFTREVDADDQESIFDDFEQLEITRGEIPFGRHNVDVDFLFQKIAAIQKPLQMLKIESIDRRSDGIEYLLENLKVRAVSLWVKDVFVEPYVLSEFLCSVLHSGATKNLLIERSECNSCLQEVLRRWIDKTPDWKWCELQSLEFSESHQVLSDIISDFISSWARDPSRARSQVLSVGTDGRFVGEALEAENEHPEDPKARFLFSYDGHSACKAVFNPK
ncbi:hypothetical protein QR680_008772 [Steinernema hermaphroditum]|uniref:Uncharacterized protein n=1 Tax=Steinernema hermaphroditum TaxID=289476 RepID=A0AA39M8A1_9BILA|nr:hypothetical protein QR680_008772 [Steinernema hermaphroditum]